VEQAHSTPGKSKHGGTGRPETTEAPAGGEAQLCEARAALFLRLDRMSRPLRTRLLTHYPPVSSAGRAVALQTRPAAKNRKEAHTHSPPTSLSPPTDAHAWPSSTHDHGGRQQLPYSDAHGARVQPGGLEGSGTAREQQLGRTVM